MRGRMALPPFTEQRLYFYLQTVVPAEVTDDIYESQSHKQMEILHFCYEQLLEDVRRFEQDQQTTSLMGMARSVLG